MTQQPTHMRREIAEIPDAVARLLADAAPFVAVGAALREKDPALLVTVARGSSDHAAAFLKYAVELTAGVPVASLGPSIASIYKRPLRLARAATIAISQSGKSPDIVTTAAAAGHGGALTIALTNAIDSPLAHACTHAIDIQAGREISVAATKSFVSSIVAGLAVLAEWQEDAALASALSVLPAHLSATFAAGWPEFAEALDGHESLYVLGRGPAMAIAEEAALKFKETAGVKAESYSAAELMHGPVSIVRPGFPVLALVSRDAAEASVVEVADRLAAQGAIVFATSDRVAKARRLPFTATGHPLTDALALVPAFYGFVEAFARRRGLNPDTPPNLSKVTETL